MASPIEPTQAPRPPADYPAAAAARDRWILERRGPRPSHDVYQPQAAFLEEERADHGQIVPVLTVLLTGRECPWRCVMCDLWKGTVTQPVPAGAVPRQVRLALERTPGAGAARHLKLYNSGSFFDTRSVPVADYPEIAALLTPFEEVVVECHPALVGRRTLEFYRRLGEAARAAGRTPPRLEVAMGLETAHPEALERLNKRVSLADFRRAAEFLRRHEIGLRVFVLVQPPFVPPGEAVTWAVRSTDFARDCGAGVVVLIPTRPGNGALVALRSLGHFQIPRLDVLEAALEASLARGSGARVFADLWNLVEFADCQMCLAARRQRLERMNREQIVLPPVRCPACGAGGQAG